MTIFSGGVGLVVQVGATVLLARLLTPADFGVVTMVTTFSFLLMNFGLNGLTEAVVQRDTITHELASSLFWFNVGCSLLLTIAFAAAGSLLAWFYKDPNVQWVAVGISLTIFLTGTSVLHLALLKRAMRFSEVSFNDIRARVLAAIVSIGLAWAGWGYWALVAAAIAYPLCVSIGAWVMCRWTPGRPRVASGLGPMLRFAFHTYGSFTVNYASRNTDNLLVGWRFNAQALGYYKKAYDLFALSATQLVSSISVVVVSALSRVNRDMDQYRRYLLGAITVMAFLGMGIGMDLTLIGKDLIRLLLGPKWGPAGQIFTFFGPGIGVMILYHTHGWIHLSIGRPDRWLRWGIIEFFVTCILFILGLHYGPQGIAAAWTISFWILTIPAMWYAGRPIGLGVGPALGVTWRYLVASLVAGGMTAELLKHLPRLAGLTGASGAALRVTTVTASLAVLYVSAVIVLHWGLAPIRQFSALLALMVGREKPSQEPSTEWVPQPATAVAEYPALLAERTTGGMEPVVSILIPAYNAEKWIADTIQSALAQTWKRIEIIVVDDGSTDRTFEVASQFESQTVRVVRQANQGAAAARNTAFSLSHGDYIQWLDADDLLAPDKISLQMAARTEGTTKFTVFSGSWGNFMYRPHRAKFRPTALWADLAPVDWLFHKLADNIYMQTATWLVSRELTEAAGRWDTRLLGDDDGEYFCRVLLASAGVRFVSDAKVYYRTFGFDNLSYIGNDPRKINAHWLSMKMHVKYVRSLEDSPRLRKACLSYLQTSLIYFYPERSDIVQEAEQIAMELGSSLGVPLLPWKYYWIERLFGWQLAKPVQRSLRRFRWSIERRLDKFVSIIERNSLFRFRDERHDSLGFPMRPEHRSPEAIS